MLKQTMISESCVQEIIISESYMLTKTLKQIIQIKI